MGLTSSYSRLADFAPTVEQIAAYKKKRKMRLSKKELALLAQHRAESKQRRRTTKNLATQRRHPERKPGPVTTKQGAMSGAILNPDD